MANNDDKGEELDNLFVGGEEDDLSDMEYVHDEDSTRIVETQPPETKEEADILAEQEAAEAKAKEETAEDEEELVVEEPVAKEPEPEPEPEVADDPKIPKDRFDEVNDRMKTAEKERDELKAQLNSVVEEKNEEPEPEPFDYKAKELEAMEAMLEGDGDKYSAINEEIRVAEKAEYVREAQKIASQGDQQVQESVTFDEVGAKVEKDFPQFVEGGEDYNHDAREELMDLYVGYAKSGLYTRAQALQRAADKAAKIHGLTATTEVVPEVPDNVVDIKPTDAKAKAAAANAQPPAMESRAMGSEGEPRVDVNSMSDEEFEAMPESTKRRMRGDIL